MWSDPFFLNWSEQSKGRIEGGLCIIYSSVILLLFQVTGPATNVVKLAILPENVQAKVVVVVEVL